jgi:hypothetical protein
MSRSAGLSRRLLLGALAAAPFAALRAEDGATQPACYDPAALPGRERSMRRSLGFKEVSDSPEKRCGSCAFFTAKQGDCGTCELLAGGQTTAKGICNSWALKEAG